MWRELYSWHARQGHSGRPTSSSKMLSRTFRTFQGFSQRGFLERRSPVWTADCPMRICCDDRSQTLPQIGMRSDVADLTWVSVAHAVAGELSQSILHDDTSKRFPPRLGLMLHGGIATADRTPQLMNHSPMDTVLDLICCLRAILDCGLWT